MRVTHSLNLYHEVAGNSPSGTFLKQLRKNADSRDGSGPEGRKEREVVRGDEWENWSGQRVRK